MADPFSSQKGPFVRDLQPGARFIGFYMVRYLQLEPFRDPSRGMFLTLILSDRTGQILGRVWEDAEAAAESIERGQVIKIDGEVETYMDRVQVRILRIRPARPEEYDLRDFIPSSERDQSALLQQMDAARERIQEPHLRALVDSFFTDSDFLARFSQAPGSRRVHHAFLGGLLEHTADLLTMSETLLGVYPEINTDLFFTGILLHDIGKLREYTWETDIEYTDEGQLLGPVALSYEMVDEAVRRIEGFPPDLSLRLRHMLVSYRGRLEWGAARRPQTIEAIALHHLQSLSAQVNRFRILLDNRPASEPWTPYDRLLGRQLYAGGVQPGDDSDWEG